MTACDEGGSNQFPIISRRWDIHYCYLQLNANKEQAICNINMLRFMLMLSIHVETTERWLAMFLSKLVIIFQIY